MEPKDGPAFPVVGMNQFGTQSTMAVFNYGMSKRELLAGLAMQGLCASGCFLTQAEMRKVPKEAVILADALLAALGEREVDK